MLFRSVQGNGRLGRTFSIVGVVSVGALVYTLPWLHALAHRGILQYDTDKAIATVWDVPIKAYAFVALQVAFTGALTLVVLRRAWWRS